MTIPLPENFKMRSPKQEEAEKVALMFNRFEMFTEGEKSSTAEVLAKIWKFPGFNLTEDARIIIDGEGNPLGYTAVWNDTKPHVQNFIVQKFDPEYIGSAIEETLMDWAVEKAHSNISKAPDDAQVFIGQTINSILNEKIERLKNRGFSEKRYFWRMGIDLNNKNGEEVEFPEDIEVTTHSARQNLMDIVKCDRKCFSDHWGYTESPLDEEFKEWEYWIKMEPFYDPDYWFLACSGDEIVGMSLCMNGMTIDNQIGYLDSVCVRKDFRKRGIASALLKHSFKELEKAGRDKAYLHVDADSLTGALKLYESVGMKENQRSTKLEMIIREGINYRTEKI